MKKRTTIFLEEGQIEGVDELAESLKIPPAKVIRIAIDFYLSLSEPTGPMADVEFVRQKMIEKRGGADVDYREVLRELAYEKAVEYRNRQNSFARLSTLVEKEEGTQEALTTLADKEEATAEVLTTLAQEVRRLVKSIDRLAGEMKNVRPNDN